MYLLYSFISILICLSSRFVYTGQRRFRGILADVWTGETKYLAGRLVPVESLVLPLTPVPGEKLGDRPDDPYTTVELFFSSPSYSIQVQRSARNSI